MDSRAIVSISIVSHGHGEFVSALLRDIAVHRTLPMEIILTLNIPEDLPPEIVSLPFPVKVTENSEPRGFAANHNAAFARAEADYFCILNPDVRITEDPFPELIRVLQNPDIGVAGPLVLNTAGKLEDSARQFPTVANITRKIFFGAPEAQCPQNLSYPDWIAGMFMICRSAVFRDIGGFDEGYFLYYEDVDLCWRMRRKGLQVAQSPGARATHDARRTSHRNLRYLIWHFKSMARFFFKRGFSSRT